MTDYDTLTNAPQQKRSQALTLQILSAAERMMRRQGAEVTIREVALEAGVSLGGIYARFADREELLSAVHARLLQRLERRVIKGVSSPKVESMSDVLDAFIRAVETTCREDGHALAVLRTGANVEAGLQRIARTEEVLCRALEEALHKFREQIKRPDPEVAIKVVTQIVLGTLARTIAHSGKVGVANWSSFCGEMVAAVDGYLSSTPPARSSNRRFLNGK